MTKGKKNTKQKKREREFILKASGTVVEIFLIIDTAVLLIFQADNN